MCGSSLNKKLNGCLGGGGDVCHTVTCSVQVQSKKMCFFRLLLLKSSLFTVYLLNSQ